MPIVRPEITVKAPTLVNRVKAFRTGIGLTANASAKLATVIDSPGTMPPFKISSHSCR
jgi:hypothetical protein